MAAAAAAGATLLLDGLLDEIVIWEIFVRLDPKSLLRCRAVRRAWRCATSTRRFLLAHHARQPALPIVRSQVYSHILSFDHRAATAAQLHTVARLHKYFVLEASCDGLLAISKSDYTEGSPTRRLSVCNPVTREHASLGSLPDFNILGMYPHRPTGEYRLLLQRRCYIESSKYQTGCYVLALGSDEAPRYIGCSDTKLASAFFDVAVRLRDSLHWYPLEYVTEGEPWEYEVQSELVIIFDTIAESFQQIKAPVLSITSYIFEMDDMLGIYSCNMATKNVDIWVLQNYESEVWVLKYQVQLPTTEIRGKLDGHDGFDYWDVTVTSGDGDVLLLVRHGHSLFYVDTEGKLVASFHHLYDYKHRLKQTLVPHDFLTTLDGYAAEASPFI